MNEGMPYLQMRRGVWVSFCKIGTVSFLSFGYKSDGLYCRMAGTPSSPTLFFIRVYFIPTLIKTIVGDDHVPAILQYRPSDLYLTDRKETNGNFAKRYPYPSPDLQIRPSLVHPFLPQDKLLIQMHLDACNAWASC